MANQTTETSFESSRLTVDDGSGRAGVATPPHRVLIADRHPIVRLGLRASLEQSGQFRVVGETDSGEGAITLGQRLRPEVVVLEVRLAGGYSGIEVVRALRQSAPSARFLVLSGFANESYVRLMIEAGVDGYVLKESPPADIVDSVRTILSARQVFSAGLKGALTNERSGHEGNRLTRKQLDVLQRLADGNLNDEIARSMGISVKAVQIHLSAIYSRLGARTRTEAVVMAAKKGIVAIATA